MELFLLCSGCQQIDANDYGRQNIAERSAAWQPAGFQETDIGIYSTGVPYLI